MEFRQEKRADGIHKGEMFSLSSGKAPNAECVLHYHEYYEVELVTEGSARQIINGVVYDMKPGDIYLMTLTDIHGYLNDGGMVSLLNLKFDEGSVSNECVSMMYMSGSAFLVNTGEKFQYMQELFKAAIQEYRGKKQGYLRVLKCMTELICAEILRLCVPESGPACEAAKRTGNDRVAGSVVTYIKSHYCRQITVRSIAERFLLSPNYLGKRFAEMYGMTIGQYIKRLRLMMAMNLLVQTDMPVGNIAREVGYRTHSMFAADFRAYYGRTPSECRDLTSR